MLCNPLSFYPAKIDPLLFFQDGSLDTIEIINAYNALISKGKYSEASEYINRQSGICGYFADFFNAIENRIYNLQEHLLTIKPKQPFILSDEEPEIKVCGTHNVLFNYSYRELSKYTHKELAAITNDQSLAGSEIIWI